MCKIAKACYKLFYMGFFFLVGSFCFLNHQINIIVYYEHIPTGQGTLSSGLFHIFYRT